MKRCTRSLKYLREPLLFVVLYMVMVNNYHADFCGLAFPVSITTGEPFNLHPDLLQAGKKTGEREWLVVRKRRDKSGGYTHTHTDAYNDWKQ